MTGKCRQGSVDPLKKRNIWRSCCVVLFVLMISTPLLCGLAQKEVPAELTNTETPEAPAFSLRGFLNGSFQSAFDGYWSGDFPNHHILTKIYNQMRYTLVGEGPSPYVRGKDGYIHDTNYIDEALCLNEGRAADISQYEAYADLLISVQKIAESAGKKITLILTPNRVDDIMDTLPDSYRFAKPAYEPTNAERLRSALNEKGVAFVDCRRLADGLPRDQYPLWTKGGVHWSLNYSAEMLGALYADYYRGESVENAIDPVVLGHFQTEKERYLQDNDMWQAMNLLVKPDDPFIYPIVAESSPNGAAKYPKIMIQGGSFTYTLLDLIAQYGLAESMEFAFYTMSDYHWTFGEMIPSLMAGRSEAITTYETDSIIASLRDCDWLILEINECFVPFATQDDQWHGSSYDFLELAARVWQEEAQPAAEAADTAEQWLNFAPVDGHTQRMGTGRGVIRRRFDSPAFLEMRIPWARYDEFCSDFTPEVRVFAGGELLAAFSPDGSGEQTADVLIPEGTGEITIYASGMFNDSGEINQYTVFSSLYATLLDAQTRQPIESGAQAEDSAPITEDQWTNFFPTETYWQRMGTERGVIRRVWKNHVIVVLRIPWAEYKALCAGFDPEVSVYADDQLLATLTDNGEAEQIADVYIPAGTDRIIICANGVVQSNGGAQEPEYYSLDVTMKEAD